MSQDNNQERIEQPTISDSSESDKNRRNWRIDILSVIAMGYLTFSLFSPLFLKQGQQPLRKIEAPDIILIVIVLIFNSDLLNRLEDFGISKDGGITAKFKQLKQEVNQQKQQIDQIQAQQLEQLEQQQKNLESMQAFMYNFLLDEKEYEKIDQLDKHSQAKTNYDFYVSDRVGDELRRLRDLKLISTKSGYISDIVRASDYGKLAIDLTKYLDVTDLGKKFLITRGTLQSNNQQG